MTTVISQRQFLQGFVSIWRVSTVSMSPRLYRGRDSTQYAHLYQVL